MIKYYLNLEYRKKKIFMLFAIVMISFEIKREDPILEKPIKSVKYVVAQRRSCATNCWLFVGLR